MILKRANCPHCKYSLPLDSAFYKITPPPRQIACRACKQTINTTFAFRSNWMTMTLFRASTFAFFLYLYFGGELTQLGVAGALGALFFAVCFGGVLSIGFGVFIAPLLQGVLDAGNLASRLAKKNMEFSEEERFMQAMGMAAEAGATEAASAVGELAKEAVKEKAPSMSDEEARLMDFLAKSD